MGPGLDLLLLGPLLEGVCGPTRFISREPCYHGRCMWSAGTFSCLICQHNTYRTKSSPAECSLIIGRLVFISALIHKHQVHRCII